MKEKITDVINICDDLSKARDLNTTLSVLVKSITEIMGVKGSSIRLLDERKETLRVAAAYGLSASYIQKGPVVLSESPVEREILKGRVVGTPDLLKEKNVRYIEEAKKEGIRSVLNVPLMAGEKTIGVVRVYRAEPHVFNPGETERLKALAAFGGVLVDRARLWDEMRALICISQSISSTLSLKEVLQLIAENASRAVVMKAASIRLLDDEGKRLQVMAAYGLSKSYLEKGPVELEKSPIDRECISGKCVSIPDIAHQTKLQYPEEIRKEGIGAVLSVPLIVKGKAIGVLRVYSPVPYEFSSSDEEFLSVLAAFGAIAIENARLFEHVKKEYEELTKDVWKWYDWGTRFPAI
jgi:signal transduction protein with GAF and PtsI domain